MEQQDEEYKTLEYLGEKIPLKFIDGVYYVKGYKTAFSSRKRAYDQWLIDLRKQKVKELTKELKLNMEDTRARNGSTKGLSQKRCRIIKELDKWQDKS